MICSGDADGREINYLRISVTDRCNLRCLYCMPKKGIKILPREEILSYGEIVFLVKAAVKAGFSRLRITGGEPLIRKDLVKLISAIAEIEGVKDLSLTTNGIFLKEHAYALKGAGISRVNVSLDTTEPETYARITRGGDVKRVLEGIEEALKVGFFPVKLNAVIFRGINDELSGLVDFIFKYPLILRLIEYKPIDTPASGLTAGLSCAELIRKVEKFGKLIPSRFSVGSGPAFYFSLKGARGLIGFIPFRDEKFCKYCNKLRLTADGRLLKCLFSENGLDVKSLIRDGANLEELEEVVKNVVRSKFNFSAAERKKIKAMSLIGG